jgi:uncharacterized protein YoxC
MLTTILLSICGIIIALLIIVLVVASIDLHNLGKELKDIRMDNDDML